MVNKCIGTTEVGYDPKMNTCKERRGCGEVDLKEVRMARLEQVKVSAGYVRFFRPLDLFPMDMDPSLSPNPSHARLQA